MSAGEFPGVLINKSQLEALSEANHRPDCDNELAKVCENTQTESRQDAANDQAIIDKTDCCTDVADDLSSVDRKGLIYRTAR